MLATIVSKFKGRAVHLSSPCSNRPGYIGEKVIDVDEFVALEILREHASAEGAASYPTAVGYKRSKGCIIADTPPDEDDPWGTAVSRSSGLAALLAA